MLANECPRVKKEMEKSMPLKLGALDVRSHDRSLCACTQEPAAAALKQQSAKMILWGVSPE